MDQKVILEGWEYFKEIWVVLGRKELPKGCLQVVLMNGPTLPEGTHYLPFSFNLPPTIPATYEGAYGKVRWEWWFPYRHRQSTDSVGWTQSSGTVWSPSWCGTGSLTMTWNTTSRCEQNPLFLIVFIIMLVPYWQVLAELDLNNLAEAGEGGRSQDQKNLHFCCFRSLLTPFQKWISHSEFDKWYFQLSEPVR